MRIVARQGDSLWLYSVWFEIPLNLILESNPTIEKLMIGQEVEIPGYDWRIYEVKAGDSLWSIAKANNITVSLLLQSNPEIEQQEKLQIGTRLMIPNRLTYRVVNTDNPYNFAQYQEDITALLERYPFIDVHSIGESVMGKPIYEIRIGNGLTEIHFNAGMHANEWITSSALMNVINDFLLALTNSEDIGSQTSLATYSGYSFSFVPMVNPDGVDLVVNQGSIEEPYRSQALRINKSYVDFSGWKANINGVDLNKQFPALWQVDASQGPQEPSPRDYSGQEPLTEPEVIALAELTKARDFDRVFALHTQGREIYYGFNGREPASSQLYAEEIARRTGYEAIRNVNSTGGYKDWFIQDWGRPGFTIEFGLGQNPLPLDQLDQITEDLQQVFEVSLLSF